MRKILITIAVVVAVLLAAAGIATIAYTHSDDYTSDSLPEGIRVNGVNCSGMSYDEATKALTDVWNSKHIQVVGKLGETLEDFTDFDCTYDLEGPLSTVKKDYLIPAALNHYFHIPFDATIAMKVKDCSADFKVKVRNSEFLNREGVTETHDAYVDMSDPSFPIVPEVYGTKADPDAFMDDILHAIAMGQFRFEYDESSYLAKPEVKQDDPELISYQKFCQDYLNQKITYELGDETFTLTAEKLDALMKDDLSGNADPAAIKKYVSDLKKKYDIEGGEVEFHSLTGKTFKVSRGNYCWVIDETGEADQLTADINSHKDVKRPPVFSQTATGEYSKKLNIGDTYVDADLGKQHVIFFKDGKKKWESDCVSGCIAYGHDTPAGVYSILGKGRGITLTSGGKKNSPGYYESYVSYWMPFIGNNYGLHDANWRSEFGGDIYKYSGSHGCINLPPSKAGELYEVVSVGDPVIVHYN